jgi:hypothetical protein
LLKAREMAAREPILVVETRTIVTSIRLSLKRAASLVRRWGFETSAGRGEQGQRNASRANDFSFSLNNAIEIWLGR